ASPAASTGSITTSSPASPRPTPTSPTRSTAAPIPSTIPPSIARNSDPSPTPPPKSSTSSPAPSNPASNPAGSPTNRVPHDHRAQTGRGYRGITHSPAPQELPSVRLPPNPEWDFSFIRSTHNRAGLCSRIATVPAS